MTVIDPPIKDDSSLYKNNPNYSILIKDTLDSISIEKQSSLIKEKDINDLDQYSIRNLLSKRKKWFILSIVTLQGFLGPLTSSIYVPAIVEIRQSLNASHTEINATISLYVFMMGIAPLLWASLSESNGRRAIYLLSTLLYTFSSIGCALTHSIVGFIILRALQAIGASASQAVGAGTITDLFEVQHRGNAMGFFLLGALIGPILGPILGGFINQFFDWRFIFWFLTTLGTLTFLIVLFFLPETSSLILKKRTEHDLRPPRVQLLLPIRCLTQPLMLSTLPYAIAYGAMYYVIATLPHQLKLHYGFESYQVGLAYVANGTGNAIGAYLAGYLSDRGLVLDRLESRLRPMWIGVMVLPIGLGLYGWSMHYGWWIGYGVVGLFLVGLGVGCVQTPGNTYVVDVYQKYSASVMSAANVLRCVSAGCTPLIAPTLIQKIGNGWSTTIMAILCGLSGVFILVVQRYGQAWRDKSKDF